MNKLILSFLVLVSMILMTSCGDDPEGPMRIYDCEFDFRADGAIDEEERAIMDECMKQALTSKEDIERNLMGEWKLVGHGEGWVTSTPEPCGYIIFSGDQLILEIKSIYRDTVSSHEWMIEEVSDGSGSNFHLRIEPYAHELAMNVFCESYIYVDYTPVDGNMYLYEKVK